MAANTSCVEYTHIVEVLLGDEIQIMKAIEGANILPQRRELIEFLRDHNKINALKWKATEQCENDVDDAIKREMKNIPYFIVFYQNGHGVLPQHPVDITQYTRDDFEIFLECDLGEVKYSPSDAFRADTANFPQALHTRTLKNKMTMIKNTFRRSAKMGQPYAHMHLENYKDDDSSGELNASGAAAAKSSNGILRDTYSVTPNGRSCITKDNVTPTTDIIYPRC